MTDEQEKALSQGWTAEGEREETATPQGSRSGYTRRSFLSHLGAAGIAATAVPALAQTDVPTAAGAPQAAAEPVVPGAIPVTLSVNGKQHALQLDPRTTLLDCLRENLDLTGTKKGCDHGQCGACTVHVNGVRVNSCLSFAAMHAEDEITTIEGVGQPGNLHRVQAAFVEHDAYQCGYCTSGQIMSAVALEKEHAVLESDADVQKVMYGNICRCGAYPNIVAAVRAAYSRS